MEKKQKLELTWIGKYEKPRLEPRILIEDPTLSYHANKRFNEKDIFNNIIIPFFPSRIKILQIFNKKWFYLDY